MARSLLADIQAQFRKGAYRFTLHVNRRLIERHIAVIEVKEAVVTDVPPHFRQRFWKMNVNCLFPVPFRRFRVVSYD